jgi:hypothetical protein
MMKIIGVDVVRVVHSMAYWNLSRLFSQSILII